MNNNENIIRNKSRIYFLDNLRTFMIFLVVLLHSGLVYEMSGISALWWIVDDPATNHIAGIINLILDIFVMATIFFISGYLTPISLKTKKWRQFVISKFKRLIIPWIFGVLILIPVYKIIFLYSRNMPQEHWTTYFHFTNGIWNQNWLWFLPILFMFNMIYLLISKINIKRFKISIELAAGIIFVISLAYSLFMKFFNLQGWTKTILFDFQNERLLIYFMLFILGAICSVKKIFELEIKSKAFYYIVSSITWIPLASYVLLLLNSFIRPGSYIVGRNVDQILIQISLNVSLFCLVYVMVNTFRLFFNKQGRISKELNKNSYGVYIIHTVILGGIALLMLNTAIPSLLKYLILTLSTFLISNIIIYLYKLIINIIKEKIKLKKSTNLEVQT